MAESQYLRHRWYSKIDQVYFKDLKSTTQRKFPCFKDKELNVCGEISRKIVKVVGLYDLGSR